MRGDELILIAFCLLAVVSLAVIIPSLILRHKKLLMRHKERMLALERGAELPAEPPEPSAGHRVYLRRGLLWLFTGVALTLFAMGVAYNEHNSPERLEYQLSRAERLREMGATEEQIRAENVAAGRRSGPGYGMALIGLIPIAVGAAYLVFYRSEEQPYRIDESAGS